MSLSPCKCEEYGLCQACSWFTASTESVSVSTYAYNRSKWTVKLSSFTGSIGVPLNNCLLFCRTVVDIWSKYWHLRSRQSQDLVAKVPFSVDIGAFTVRLLVLFDASQCVVRLFIFGILNWMLISPHKNLIFSSATHHPSAPADKYSLCFEITASCSVLIVLPLLWMEAVHLVASNHFHHTTALNISQINPTSTVLFSGREAGIWEPSDPPLPPPLKLQGGKSYGMCMTINCT